MEPMGVSFMPGQQDDQTKKPGSEAPQDAIKTLNLAIPRVVGAGSPVNPSMLFGAGSQGMPTNGFGGLEAFLRRLFGQMPPAAPSAGPVSPGGAPLPPTGSNGRINVPGTEPGAPPAAPPPPGRTPFNPSWTFGEAGAEQPLPPPTPPPAPLPEKSTIDQSRYSDGFNF